MKYNCVVDDVIVTSNQEVSEEEILRYIGHIRKENGGRNVQSLSLEFDGDEVGLGYYLTPAHFEKIRRITGYLVGDMSHWNDAKASEENDRVKHA